jgi:hypothetical protein
LTTALNGPYYKNTPTGSSDDPELVDSIKQAQAGSDTIHGATGNASKHVGFGVPGGHYDSNKEWVSPNQVARINGERFGFEEQDIARGWPAKYKELKGESPDIAAGSR